MWIYIDRSIDRKTDVIYIVQGNTVRFEDKFLNSIYIIHILNRTPPTKNKLFKTFFFLGFI